MNDAENELSFASDQHRAPTAAAPSAVPALDETPRRPAGERGTPATVPLVLDPADPLASARAFAQRRHTVAGRLALRHHLGVFYEYDGAGYRERDELSVRADVYEFLEAARTDGRGARGRSRPEPFRPTRGKVDNVVDAMRAVAHLPASAAVPGWLGDAAPAFDPLDMLADRTGRLVHLPTRQVLPPTPDFFTLNALEFAYDAAAPAPDAFLAFLRDLWGDDDETIGTLQEWMGLLLTPDTRFQKIAMLVGPKRSGKGTIGRLIRRLVGERNVCAPMLANLGEQFGRAVLVGRSVAIIADARLGGRTDAAVVAETLLSISGEDPQTVPRKFLPDWTGKLPTRFTVLTNELPRIEDSSGALASRFIVLPMQHSFIGREDHALLDRLLPELPGILNWALDGRDRLYARGRFHQPAAAAALLATFEDLGSPIGAYVRDRCVVGQGHEISAQRLYDDWKDWCRQSGREKPGTIQVFGRNLRAAFPWLGETFPRMGGGRVRHYQGIDLQPVVVP